MKQIRRMMIPGTFIFCLTFLFSCATNDVKHRHSRDHRGETQITANTEGAGTRTKRDQASTETAGPRTRTAERTVTRPSTGTGEQTDKSKEIADRPARPQSEPSASPQEFKDFSTGLTFTYAGPWKIIKTEMAGPILGKERQPLMEVRFSTFTTDKKKAAQPGFIYSAVGTLANTFVYSLDTLTKPVQEVLEWTGIETGGGGGKKSPPVPLDVALTRKHFPSLKIEQRFRGNDGRSIVNICRQAGLPDTFYVYHVIEGEKIASFSLKGGQDVRLREEAQKIIYSTR